MWTFQKTEKVEQAFGQWYALVTLDNDGVPESFYLSFPSEPSAAEANAAGVAFTLKRNLQSGAVVSDSITREDFFSRFTNTEIAAIYRASTQNDDLFAYVKKLEINPTVNKKNADVVAGLGLLEAVGLLGAGRAAEILGA